MKLTTKGRFAVTAVLDMALHATHGPVTLSAISERQHISLSYLEQLFGKLRRGNIVQSVRGPGGGYLLARAPATVSVADIIAAVEETIDSRQCSGKENCLGEKRCMTHELWENLNHAILDHLSGVSLAELVEKQTARTPADANVIRLRPAKTRNADGLPLANA